MLKHSNIFVVILSACIEYLVLLVRYDLVYVFLLISIVCTYMHPPAVLTNGEILHVLVMCDLTM